MRRRLRSLVLTVLARTAPGLYEAAIRKAAARNGLTEAEVRERLEHKP